MTTSNFYSVGLNHVGAYQVSGTPFVDRITLNTTQDVSSRIQFESVTKRIVVRGHGLSADVRIHFAPYDNNVDSSNGLEYGFSNEASTHGNFVTIASGETVEFFVKCKEIFVSPTAGSLTGEVEVLAELTNIPAARMFSLDGVEGVATP
jgi:hypothetical protein|tara:strand:+ start:22 stop:468 length:447 start_codon:yes stop_codon:yes gene_type:complete